jgi:hypothetical protein
MRSSRKSLVSGTIKGVGQPMNVSTDKMAQVCHFIGTTDRN